MKKLLSNLHEKYWSWQLDNEKPKRQKQKYLEFGDQAFWPWPAPPADFATYGQYQPKFVPIESARKAKRNLLFCLFAMGFVAIFEVSILEFSFLGTKANAKSVPLDFLIVLLSWLFFLNWLQPIAEDNKTFRLSWNQLKSDFNSAIAKNQTNIKDHKEKLGNMTNYEILEFGLRTPPEVGLEVEGWKHASQVVNSYYKIKTLKTLRIRRRISHYYNWLVAQFLPIFAPALCTAIFILCPLPPLEKSLQTPLCDRASGCLYELLAENRRPPKTNAGSGAQKRDAQGHGELPRAIETRSTLLRKNKVQSLLHGLRFIDDSFRISLKGHPTPELHGVRDLL